MILILYILTPFTMTYSIHLFQGFRIIHTRMMLLTILHGHRPNPKLKSILEGCADLQHLWGFTLHSHNLFSRQFFQPQSVYIRFTHIQSMQPKFYVGSAMHHVQHRSRKYLQLTNERLVQAELALRYWQEHDNLYIWAPIPIYTDRSDYRSLKMAQGDSSTGPMVPRSRPPKNLEEVSATMACQDACSPGTMSHSKKPSFKTVFIIKHAAVLDILCNHKQAIDDWSTTNPATCCCKSWSCYKSAALNPSDSHWVLSGSLLHSHLQPDLAVIAEGSLANKVFPSKKEFQNQLRLGLKNWTKRNGLPSMPQSDITDLCHLLRQQHLSQITDHITKQSIGRLQDTFDGAIFHCEDKHASSLRIFCPCIYFKSIEKTFQDPSIFESLPSEPSSIVTSLVESLQRQHGRAYPWAVGSGRQLPSGYILAKRKKDFRSGRPIISFVDSPFRPMLNILARLIFQLIPTACPNHFATGDVYTLLAILRSAPVDADLILVNQDLAGFFTSIDQDRFLRSWFMLLDFLRPKMNVYDEEVFSVYPGKSNNPGDIIKGRTFRRLNVTRKIVVGDVPDLIKSALHMQTFALGQRCIRQRRGSPMGSPLSPALCLMVVSISEQIWYHTFHQLLSNHHLFIKHVRYVDNRLIFGDKRLTSFEPYEVLLDDGFYGKPIILETEPDQEFLGFMIETKPLELIYQGPTQVSQVLSPFSASPPSVLLSGFRSRCHIVIKRSFPISACPTRLGTTNSIIRTSWLSQ